MLDSEEAGEAIRDNGATMTVCPKATTEIDTQERICLENHSSAHLDLVPETFAVVQHPSNSAVVAASSKEAEGPGYVVELFGSTVAKVHVLMLDNL